MLSSGEDTRSTRLVAAREGLTVEHGARGVGLVPDFMALGSDTFDPTSVHPEVRRFYEKTSDYDLEAWSESPTPKGSSCTRDGSVAFAAAIALSTPGFAAALQDAS